MVNRFLLSCAEALMIKIKQQRFFEPLWDTGDCQRCHTG